LQLFVSRPTIWPVAMTLAQDRYLSKKGHQFRQSTQGPIGIPSGSVGLPQLVEDASKAGRIKSAPRFHISQNVARESDKTCHPKTVGQSSPPSI